MFGLGLFAVILLCLGAALIVDGAVSLWSGRDDNDRQDGVVVAGVGAALLFGSVGAFLGAEG